MSHTHGCRYCHASNTVPALRDAARALVDRASDDEDRIEALVAAADTDTRRAEAELSHAGDLTSSSVDDVRRILRSQLERSVDGARAARQLLARAREQTVAAARLLSHAHCDLSDEPPEALRGRHAVLVVDDYSENREFLSVLLHNAGFVVHTAANGLEGLYAAYEMRPGVIVMDLTMPVLDGLEATRLIKATDATRHARVIAYTGNPTAGERHVGELFVTVLQKPASPDTVIATVQHAASL